MLSNLVNDCRDLFFHCAGLSGRDNFLDELFSNPEGLRGRALFAFSKSVMVRVNWA